MAPHVPLSLPPPTPPEGGLQPPASPLSARDGEVSALAQRRIEAAQPEGVPIARAEDLSALAGFETLLKDRKVDEKAIQEAYRALPETERHKVTLTWAAARGHTAVINLLLSQGPPPPPSTVDRVAQVAAVGGHTGVIAALVNLGTSLDSKALSQAVVRAAAQGNVEMVEALLGMGKAIDTKALGQALARAAAGGHAEVVGRILDKGRERSNFPWRRSSAPPQQKIDKKLMIFALKEAIIRGDSDLVELLLTREEASFDRATLLKAAWMAVGEGKQAIAIFLVRKISPDKLKPAEKKQLKELVCLSCSKGEVEVLGAFKEELVHEFKFAAAAEAIKGGHTRVIHSLFPPAAKLGSYDVDWLLWEAVRANQPDIIGDVLHNYNFDADKIDFNKPIEQAVVNGRDRILKIFLDYVERFPGIKSEIKIIYLLDNAFRAKQKSIFGTLFRMFKNELEDSTLFGYARSAINRQDAVMLRFFLGPEMAPDSTLGGDDLQELVTTAVDVSSKDRQLEFLKIILPAGRTLYNNSLVEVLTKVHLLEEGRCFILSRVRRIEGPEYVILLNDALGRGFKKYLEKLVALPLNEDFKAFLRRQSCDIISNFPCSPIVSTAADELLQICNRAGILSPEAKARAAERMSRYYGTEWSWETGFRRREERRENTLIIPSFEDVIAEAPTYLDQIVRGGLPRRIELLDNSAVDAGGLTKQFLSSLVAGVCSHLPHLKGEEKLKAYENLGRLYSLIGEHNEVNPTKPLVVGEVFDVPFFEKVNHFAQGRSMENLEARVVLDPTNEEALKDYAAAMMIWTPPDDPEEAKLARLTDEERAEALESAQKSYGPALAFYRGLTPFIQDCIRPVEGVNYLLSLQGIPVTKEGLLSVLERGVDFPEERFEWLKEKIRSSDEAWRKQFVRAITGFEVLIPEKKINIWVDKHDPETSEIHTCFNSLALPVRRRFTQEEFVKEVDAAIRNETYNTR